MEFSMKNATLLAFCLGLSLLPSCSCDTETYARQSRPLITASPLEIEFGNVPLGAQATRAMDVLNAGQIALEVEAVNIKDEDMPFFPINTVLEIPGEQSAQVLISFAPVAEGTFETELTFDSNANNDSPTVILRGNGVAEQECAPCGDPPENYCIDEYNLIYYDMIGECVNGECLYRANSLYCEHGCDEETGQCKERTPYCGDSIVDTEDGEECDDGAENSNVTPDACRSNCMLPTCGDLVIDTGEICDDGNTEGGDGCRADCTEEICGDSILDPRELCDDGNNTNGDGCRADCTEEECGNAVPDVGEECDDGNSSTGDGCRPDCTEERCGDGIIDPGEACDDGNTIDDDDCKNDCTTEACGNGTLDDGEACDDGNTVNGDGCRADCTEEACGDGILDPGEECDDGNTTDADGCSASCVAEVSTQPPLCVATPDCCGTECHYEWPLVKNAGFEELDVAGKPTEWTYMLDKCGQPNNPDPPCAGFPSVEEEEGYGNVFQIDRTNYTGGGRNDYIGQSDLGDVSNCEELIFSLDAKPMEQTCSGGGWMHGEWPVGVRILYTADEPDTDGDGLPDSWEVNRYETDPNDTDTDDDGILDGDEDHNNNNRTNINENRYWRYQYGVYFLGDEPEAVIAGLDCPSSYGVQCADVGAFKVEEDTWINIPTVDLMQLDPKPVDIFRFRIGSAGWKYLGRFDNPQLTARAPKCPEE
ncbi:MAG: hypothetical protein CMH56_00305 [Myxococcales bacterium]|nr:hypothetical protein [Myxococcales bacterium]|tara:strand:- start:1553 stop:3670 length:2118 start_codon:yes stop_codon:yes gene_type:complete